MVMAAAVRLAGELRQRGAYRLTSFAPGDAIEEQTVADWRRIAGDDAALFALSPGERELVLAVDALDALS
jgi:hypothetical protein